MDKFKLDGDASKEIIISNDTYCFIMFDEEMLDDSNMLEYNRLMGEYENGFELSNEYEHVKSGHVKCILTPYSNDDFGFTHRFVLFNGWEMQFKYIDDARIAMRYYSNKKGASEEEICEIKHNCNGKPLVWTKKGSMFPLWKSEVV